MSNKILDNEEYLEPETIRTFKGENASSLEIQKELVKKLIKNTNAPFVDFYVFENVVLVLNNIEPQVDQVDGASPEQIWYALATMKEMRDDLEKVMSYEVKQYIRFAFKEDGIIFYPSGVGMPSPFLDKVISFTNEINGPIIEDDDNPLSHQAIKYLRLLEYTKSQSNKETN